MWPQRRHKKASRNKVYYKSQVSEREPVTAYWQDHEEAPGFGQMAKRQEQEENLGQDLQWASTGKSKQDRASSFGVASLNHSTGLPALQVVSSCFILGLAGLAWLKAQASWVAWAGGGSVAQDWSVCIY